MKGEPCRWLGEEHSKHSDSEARVCLRIEEEQGGVWARTAGQTGWVLGVVRA